MTKKITHIIFDVDGTLYEPIEELSTTLHSYWIKRIGDHLHIRPEEAEEEYDRLKKHYINSTLSLASIGIGSPVEIIRQAEHHMRGYHKKLIKKDRKLIKILKILKHHYTLGTLRNGSRAGTRFMLSLLGFSARRDKRSNGYGPFDYIFPTVELGPTKPDPLPYKNVLNKLEIDPDQILMIGDREKVDLKTAKEFGMRTVLVDWGRDLKYDPKITDMKIDTIYDVKELIP